MVFDFRLADRQIFEAMRVLGERGGMLQLHCEDPVLIDTAIEAALQRGNTAPRYHATTRPPEAEAVATASGDGVRPGGRCARPRRPPVVRGGAPHVAEAKAAGVRAHAETCPHYLTLTDDRYQERDPVTCACSVISPPLRSGSDRDAMWAGLADGTLDLVATDHVADRRGVEKSEAAKGVAFDKICNGAPGIETLLTMVHAGRAGNGRITLERMVDVLSTTPARLFGLGREGRDRGRQGRRPRPVRPRRPPHDPGDRPPPHERLHAVRGPQRRGSRAVGVRARPCRRPRRRVRGRSRLRPIHRAWRGRGIATAGHGQAIGR